MKAVRPVSRLITQVASFSVEFQVLCFYVLSFESFSSSSFVSDEKGLHRHARTSYMKNIRTTAGLEQ
jgi:hypothetical protein